MEIKRDILGEMTKKLIELKIQKSYLKNTIIYLKKRIKEKKEILDGKLKKRISRLEKEIKKYKEENKILD